MTVRRGRPPRLIRILAPLCSIAGVICLFYSFDVGLAEPLNLGGGQFFIPEPAVAGQPLALIRSARPGLLWWGWMLLAASAVLWLWDVATSD